MPGLLAQDINIARQQRIRGDHHIVLRNMLEALGAGAAMQGQHLERGRMTMSLILPVEHQRGRGYHQHWPGHAASRALTLQVRQHLHGLAQSHIVGQNATRARAGHKLQPGQTLLLIGAQGGLETRGYGHLRQAVERLTGLAKPLKRSRHDDGRIGHAQRRSGQRIHTQMGGIGALPWRELRPIGDHARKRLQAMGVNAQHLVLSHAQPELAVGAAGLPPGIEATQRNDISQHRRQVDSIARHLDT